MLEGIINGLWKFEPQYQATSVSLKYMMTSKSYFYEKLLNPSKFLENAYVICPIQKDEFDFRDDQFKELFVKSIQCLITYSKLPYSNVRLLGETKNMVR